MNFKKRFFLLPLFVALFVYLFFSVYRDVREKTIEDFNLQQLILAKQAARGIEGFFDFYLRSLTDLSQITDIIQFNKNGVSILQSFYRNHSDAVRAVTRLDKDGRIVHTVPFDPAVIGKDISGQQHVKTILQQRKPVVSDVFTAVQGYQAVACHVPIFADRTFQGTLAVLIPFDKISQAYLENIRIGNSGYAWVISQAGVVLFDPHPDRIGQSVFEVYRTVPDILDMAEKMVQRRQGTATFTETGPPAIRKQAAYLPVRLGNTFWSIVVATPERDILDTITVFRSKLFMIALFVLLVGLFYSYFFFRARAVLREEKQREKAEEDLQERAQLATLSADVGAALTRLDSLAEMLSQCAAAVVKNLGASFARIWLLNETTQVLELKASAGCYTHLDGPHSRIPLGSLKIGTIAKERTPHLTNAVLGDPRIPDQDWARREGMVAFAGYPLVVEDRALGVLALFSKQPLGDFTMKALAAVAVEIALGIERKQTEDSLRSSEEKFRYHFDYAVIGKAISRMDGSFVQVNPAFCEMLGYSESEVLAKRWQELILPAYLDENIERIRRMLAGDAPSYHLEMKLVHKNGRAAWIRLNVVLVKDHQGKALYLVSDIENITSRYEYEERLRKYEQIVSGSRDLMSLINKDYVYEAVNETYLAFWERKREQIVGKSVAEMMGLEAFTRKIKPRLDRALAGESVNYQESFDYPKIGTRFMDVSYFPSIDARGNVEGAVINARDITETRQLESRLAQSQKMESIGTLAGGIAHDFNNILSPIIGYTELMQMELPADSPPQKYAREILAAARRASNLVKQILTFSRQADQEIKPLKIQPILKEILKLIRSTIPSSIEIRQHIDPDCGTVLADPTQIHQIAMNLVTNASHAMADGKGVLSIGLKDVEIGGDTPGSNLEPGTYVCLSIADTGVGMDPPTIEKIFNPYFTTKERGKGTGLGLSVVHGIVTSLHGDIIVTSQPGKGSTFDIYLPKLEMQPEPGKAQAPRVLKTGSERILLVDDEPHVVFSVESLLTHLGYTVTARLSSVEALALFQDGPDSYDLVITDMTMPNLTGDMLAMEILKIRPQMPVIICTGFSEKIDARKARQFGIKGFLMKPVALHELAEMVRKLLDEK